MAPRLGLIANLGNRRAAGFVEACQTAGLPAPQTVDWFDLLRHPDRLPHLHGCDLVRIDSAGEHDAVTHLLIKRGLGRSPSRPLAYGEIGYLRAHHLGFVQVLDLLADSRLPFVTPPADIAAMFDKWATHKRLIQAGVQRPPAVAVPCEGGSGSEADPVAAVRSLELGDRLFLKPRHGSSASGVCAWQDGPAGPRLTAPIEIEWRLDGDRLYNSLRVRTFTKAADIDLLLTRLLPEALIGEEWIPKATIDGRRFDLRIVTIDGEVRHRVVRTSHHPMTNLHLGNQRGDIDRLLAVHGRDALDAADEAARRAAACFPASLVIGVDVALTTDHQAYVLELNAFGDLLPGITSRGQSTYEAAVSAMITRAGQEASVERPHAVG